LGTIALSETQNWPFASSMVKAMIRLHLIHYLLCASMSLWLDSVTAGIIITSISDKTTEAQRHRDSRTSNRAIGFLCILVNCLSKKQTPQREVRGEYFCL